jgi:hypothetical protein
MVLEVEAIAVQHGIRFMRTERGREVTHHQRNSVVMVTLSKSQGRVKQGLDVIPEAIEFADHFANSSLLGFSTTLPDQIVTRSQLHPLTPSTFLARRTFIFIPSGVGRSS